MTAKPIFKSLQYSLRELALFCGGELVCDDPEVQISGLAALSDAASGQASFLSNPHYRSQLKDTKATVVILKAEYLAECPCAAIVSEQPYLAYAYLSQQFQQREQFPKGVDVSARVAESAKVDPTAIIGPNVVLGERVVIGADCYLGANTVVGSDSEIGAGTRIEANVTLYCDVKVGESCLIHSGVVIGADGFGFANESGRWVKIAQLGGVQIGNFVEIGAGTTIDRGALKDTYIGNGVILDNQIQVAHNVSIGDQTAIAGCTAIAGSTKIGRRCTIAGACGIAGHIDIVDGTHITAMSMVTKSIHQSGVYSSGVTLQTSSQWKKNVVRFRQLDSIARRLKTVEDHLNIVEGKLNNEDGCE